MYHDAELIGSTEEFDTGHVRKKGGKDDSSLGQRNRRKVSAFIKAKRDKIREA